MSDRIKLLDEAIEQAQRTFDAGVVQLKSACESGEWPPAIMLTAFASSRTGGGLEISISEGNASPMRDIEARLKILELLTEAMDTITKSTRQIIIVHAQPKGIQA